MPSRLSATGIAAAMALVATVGIACAGSVDETALREYARQNNVDRVAAETRRLERLNPQWKPPADLWTARPSGPDEAPLWELYEDGHLDLLKKAIAERGSNEPGWRPSDDLVEKMKEKEIRAAIVAGAAGGRWIEVAKLVDDNILAHATPDIELTWIVAEALGRTERSSEAAALYASVLESRSDPRERAGTLQKALVMLPMADAEKLIAMGKTGADGRSEFEVLRLDIARARISAFLRNDPVRAVEAADLAGLEDVARASSDPREPALLAWYAYKRGELDAARDWFERSLAHGGDAMDAHGLALTLLRLGRRREAEDVAYAWRERLANNMILFIDILETNLTREVPPFIEPARLTRYAQVALKTQSGEGAQGLAWYAYNSCQLETALEWFSRAVAWFPKEATVYGYALTLQRLKRHREFIEVVNRYDGLFASVLALVFGDDRYRPPNPCDMTDPSQIARLRSEAGLEAYRATAVHNGAQGTANAARQSDAASVAARFNAALKVARSEFPLAVTPENPLRFPRRVAVAADRAGKPGLRNDGPFRFPRLARRVPGADAMPYERLGVALLPAYDGTTAAKFRAAPYYYAAVGTTWAQEGAAAAREAAAREAAPEPPPRLQQPVARLN
jgi:tetratricopeptide (TPR) repeat protein